MPGFPTHFQTMIKLLPWLVLLICLAITSLVWNQVRQTATHELQLEFDDQVREVHTRIDERLDDYRDILRGASGLYAASESIEQQEFHAYIEKLRLPQSYPGIQGVGFARLIPANKKQNFIASIRREGIPKFDIRPAGARDLYSAIIYLEPMDWRNQRAIGYDMYSEPVRRAAMERARDTDHAAISGKVILVQETEKEKQSGFLMYMPVYNNKLPHNTVAERRANLLGWVYEPFRMNDLMTKGILGKYLDTIKGELNIEIYNGDTSEQKNLMYQSSALPARTHMQGGAQFYSILTTQHFGQNWTIVIHSLPTFEAKINSDQIRFVAITGVIISFLLTWVVWLLSSTNTRAIKLAEKMSEKLELTLEQTIEAMSSLVEMRDPYTAGHQRRTAELARAIGTEIDLTKRQIHNLYLTALIYEIGKVKVPAEILSKPGKLDDVEYDLVKMHPQAGFEILQNISFPWPLAQSVQQHHERLDGSGYPQGLKGNDILLDARIIAVADVVDAMCSYRPYRAALGVEAALEEISANKGILYDPVVVDVCIKLFREQGFKFPQ